MFTGSLVAVVTPMHADGSIDFDAFERLLGWHLESGTDGIVVAGTTGEAPTLTVAEVESLVGRAVDPAAGRVPVIAGSGSNSTARTVELTRAVCAAGADGCLVVTPYYNKPPQEGLLAHYEAVAAASTRPVILYNVPGRTGCDLLPATTAGLCADPRIAGIKEAVPEMRRIEALRAALGPDKALLSGDDPSACMAMEAGADGVVSVTANVAPRAMARLCALARGGDRVAARQLDARLAPLHAALFVDSNPLPAKWLLCEMGFIENHLRLPLVPLPGAREVALRAALAQVDEDLLEHALAAN